MNSLRLHSRYSTGLALALACAPLLSTAETSPSDAGSPAATPAGDHVERLDAVIVSGSVDPKTAFDLAQGASSLSGDELRRRQQATLGETLSSVPGVSSTYYGPGSSRPMIRGLGGDRVRMLEGGVGSLDLSNISPDHTVSLEPMLTERIEVLRGPSTLLYGSSAVGGVVNVIDRRIPTELPSRALSGAAELRYDTASEARTGLFSMDSLAGPVVMHLEGLRSLSEDVRIPGPGVQGEDAPEGQSDSVLPGSAISTKSAAFGGSYFFSSGFVGISAGEYDSTYGVPTGDEPGISIALRRQRLEWRAETRTAAGPFREMHLHGGYSDYTHSELSGGETVNTRFTNKAWENRVELAQRQCGRLGGTLGIQLSHSDFEAKGEEVVTPAYATTGAALFALEELKYDKVTLEFGARLERQRIHLGEVPEELPVFSGYSVSSGELRTDSGLSLSGGAVWYPVKNYSLGLSLSMSQRLPVAQELFSNGPHGGTASYEVGSTDLGREKSVGLELTLRRKGEFVTGAVSVFANRFQGFIHEEALPEELTPELNNPDGLRAYQFVAKDALFTGAEAELDFHLHESERGQLNLLLTADYVRAELTEDHSPLPRITPMRIGSELRYRSGPWSLGTQLRYVFRQNRYSSSETATPGYALLGADLSRDFRFGQRQVQVFLQGSNLCDRLARVHSSFLKDYAPLPGRSFSIGLRAAF